MGESRPSGEDATGETETDAEGREARETSLSDGEEAGEGAARGMEADANGRETGETSSCIGEAAGERARLRPPRLAPPLQVGTKRARWAAAAAGQKKSTLLSLVANARSSKAAVCRRRSASYARSGSPKMYVSSRYEKI